MSFLTPLYILGALAVAAPVVVHLIRRTPRGEVPFSSLMFLTATPPRLTRRSRLDQVLLLLLRAAALLLLALAFARPFVREAARLDLGAHRRQRVMVLIDTSASMRRGDLWVRAKALAARALADCAPEDQVALFAFDAASQPLLGFDEAAALGPARRQAVAWTRLEALRPSWAATRLDQALIDAVGTIEDVADASEKAGRMPRRVVLVSDLQQGARLDALGEFEWPSDVTLELKTVKDARGNASVQWLAESPESESDGAGALRARVSNEPGAQRESFRLRWADTKDAPVEVHVPPGESRVVSVPPPRDAAAQPVLRLEGDPHAFDDTLYLATRDETQWTVLCIARGPGDDPKGLAYYLRRVFTDGPRAEIHVECLTSSTTLTDESDNPPPAIVQLGRATRLVVVATDTTPDNARRLKGYLSRGGTLLFVLAAPGPAATLTELAGVALADVDDAPGERDALLGEIAFDHPLFAPLAGAAFNDFTKVHFWKHRRLQDDSLGPAAKVLARFDDGDPALIERAVGRGRLYVLTSGWHPADSQLARSSKFVPLMLGLLDAANRRPSAAALYHVRDRVPLPAGAAGPVAVRKPDGTVAHVAPGQTAFNDTDEPGVYTVHAAGAASSFAVNLDPAESQTAPLEVETLAQFGCRLASTRPGAPDPGLLRQLHNAELEGRQKLWRWLIVAAVVVLIVETWLAGRARVPRAEALAT
jgi:hypothetical protein